jgi:3-deoxy-manno-octulosonate cytidylyltransferase (CMP-KDO synthetase)
MAHVPNCYAIIPARYDSSRFPGKPLAPILGKPMFWHVWSRAARCPELDGIFLATDDERISKAAADLNIPAVTTRRDHQSGTDRVFEAARGLDLPREAIVINVQGDEPTLSPDMLSELVAPMTDPAVQVSTLAREISPVEAQDPNRVKAVRSLHGQALYFSRSPVPFARDAQQAFFLGHIGLYAYRFPALEQFHQLPPSPLETIEQLEQLRLLEAGVHMHVALTGHSSQAVDRPEDIELVETILRKEKD